MVGMALTGLFACNQCGCVDLVELANPDERWLCSQCNPDIQRWHGQFPKLPYNPRIDLVVNRFNGLGLEEG